MGSDSSSQINKAKKTRWLFLDVTSSQEKPPPGSFPVPSRLPRCGNLETRRVIAVSAKTRVNSDKVKIVWREKKRSRSFSRPTIHHLQPGKTPQRRRHQQSDLFLTRFIINSQRPCSSTGGPQGAAGLNASDGPSRRPIITKSPEESCERSPGFRKHGPSSDAH